MHGRFNGKVAVVIGGNRGIGFSCAQAFAREGARVIITGRDVAALLASVKAIGSGAVYYQADVRNLSQITQLFSEIKSSYESLDTLVFNSGVLAFSPLERVSEEQWDYILDTNLKGAFFTLQGAVPLMKSGSTVVLVGSTAANRGEAMASVYSASKGGLQSLARSLAAELLDKGIRVNAVIPASTDTEIFRSAPGRIPEDLDDFYSKARRNIPMRRFGTPDEVAAAVLFLASGESGFCTGTDLLVDGGYASVSAPAAERTEVT